VRLREHGATLVIAARALVSARMASEAANELSPMRWLTRSQLKDQSARDANEAGSTSVLRGRRFSARPGGTIVRSDEPTAVEFKAEPADVQPPTLDATRWGLRESRLSVKVDGIASIAPEMAALRAPFERLVVLDVESDRGVAQIELPLQVTVGDRGVILAGTTYYLDLLIDTSTAPGVISWRLEPGGSDARSRLAHERHGGRNQPQPPRRATPQLPTQPRRALGDIG
jgi:hypothetical protein